MSDLKDKITVGIDVGCYNHRVAIADSAGHIIEEFNIDHDHLGFAHLLYKLYCYEKDYDSSVVVAMEGVNGYARPLDKMIISKGYKLLNVNNLKLSRFREMSSSPAKTDALDAREIIKLVLYSGNFKWGKDVIQEVETVPEEHNILKRLTRRRRQLVEDKVRIMNRMESDLQAVCPEILKLVKNKDSDCFLNLLTCRQSLEEIARIRRTTLLKIRGVGKKFADKVQEWQKEAHFSDEIGIVAPMIVLDASMIQELKQHIKELNLQIAEIVNSSRLGQLISSIPGFGLICTGEIVGEIGSMNRFDDEASLAYYLGMAPLDNSSGKKQGTKIPRNINTRAKAAMMTSVAHNIREVAESKIFYNRKRSEGKRHNKAVRCLGRHMVRVIWAMVKNDELYHVKQIESVKKEGKMNLVA